MQAVLHSSVPVVSLPAPLLTSPPPPPSPPCRDQHPTGRRGLLQRAERLARQAADLEEEGKREEARAFYLEKESGQLDCEPWRLPALLPALPAACLASHVGPRSVATACRRLSLAAAAAPILQRWAGRSKPKWRSWSWRRSGWVYWCHRLLTTGPRSSVAQHPSTLRRSLSSAPTPCSSHRRQTRWRHRWRRRWRRPSTSIRRGRGRNGGRIALPLLGSGAAVGLPSATLCTACRCCRRPRKSSWRLLSWRRAWCSSKTRCGAAVSRGAVQCVGPLCWCGGRMREQRAHELTPACTALTTTCSAAAADAPQALKLVAHADLTAARAEEQLPVAERAAHRAEVGRPALIQVGWPVQPRGACAILLPLLPPLLPGPLHGPARSLPAGAARRRPAACPRRPAGGGGGEEGAGGLQRTLCTT